MPGFKEMVLGPLVVRQRRHSRQEVRQQLGIPEEAKARPTAAPAPICPCLRADLALALLPTLLQLALITFGYHANSFELTERMLPPGWIGLVLNFKEARPGPPVGVQWPRLSMDCEGGREETGLPPPGPVARPSATLAAPTR